MSLNLFFGRDPGSRTVTYSTNNFAQLSQAKIKYLLLTSKLGYFYISVVYFYIFLNTFQDHEYDYLLPYLVTIYCRQKPVVKTFMVIY